MGLDISGFQGAGIKGWGRWPGQAPLTPAQPWLRPADHVVTLMPEAGSPQHARVLQYRELLDALPMDAYTHGCILHPELTTDSMIPKYATAEIRSECHGLPLFAHLSAFNRSSPPPPLPPTVCLLPAVFLLSLLIAPIPLCLSLHPALSVSINLSGIPLGVLSRY